MAAVLVVPLVLAYAAGAAAQDRRSVVEPRVPPLCGAVEARLVPVDGRLRPGDETALDTDRIQLAIDACAAGSGVELSADGARTAFLTGPLELREGVTLIVGAGVVVFASRDPRVYDVRPGSCGLVDQDGRGCRPVVHTAARDTAIVGDGAIDGRGGETLLGRTVSWWDLAEQARNPPARQNVPRLVVAERADNFVLYRITLRNSPNFHVIVSGTRGFTAWGVTIDAPAAARNTDGIDPSSSSDVTIAHCAIRTGDDHVAIKAGAGGPASHISVVHNRFYSGHGMSIGSETSGGVSDVEVRDLTIDGADNGLRIKSNRSRGGVVQDVTYADVCMRNVARPIVIDSAYDGVTNGPLVPVFGPVRFEDVRIAGGGPSAIAGVDEEHRAALAFDGVTLTGGAPTVIPASNAAVDLGPGRVDYRVHGPGVSVRTVSGTRPVPPCDDRFISFSR